MIKVSASIFEKDVGEINEITLGSFMHLSCLRSFNHYQQYQIIQEAISQINEEQNRLNLPLIVLLFLGAVGAILMVLLTEGWNWFDGWNLVWFGVVVILYKRFFKGVDTVDQRIVKICDLLRIQKYNSPQE